MIRAALHAHTHIQLCSATFALILHQPFPLQRPEPHHKLKKRRNLFKKSPRDSPLEGRLKICIIYLKHVRSKLFILSPAKYLKDADSLSDGTGLEWGGGWGELEIRFICYFSSLSQSFEAASTSWHGHLWRFKQAGGMNELLQSATGFCGGEKRRGWSWLHIATFHPAAAQPFSFPRPAWPAVVVLCLLTSQQAGFSEGEGAATEISEWEKFFNSIILN